MDAQRFRAILLTCTPRENWKQRTREVAWTDRWRHCRGRVEELHGKSGVGDMPVMRSRDEILYWRRLQIIMRHMRNGEVDVNAGSLDCVAFDVPYNRLWYTNMKVRS